MLISNLRTSIKVIFEDESIMIIEKPAGLPVYPAEGGKEETVVGQLGSLIPLIPPLEKGDEPVHRLDNDTSGLLLIAKSETSFANLRKQFDDKKVMKKYTALVMGETPKNGIIETPIIHDPKRANRMRVFSQGCGTKAKPQEAYTSFKTIKKYAGGQYSLLEIAIKTGVRHKIRVHLSSIGYPLVGDHLYQNSRNRKLDSSGLKRQFLHASTLGFHHPVSGKWVEFTSQLPQDLQNVLTKLEKI